VKALTWQGKRKVEFSDVPDPRIKEPTDAVIKVTSTGICGRGGTISLIGVYGGMADPLPMLTIFDKQLQLRMGQANVHRWSDQILPLLDDDDPLRVDNFATHDLPLSDGPAAYEMFQQKRDGAVKVLLKP
jgi:threonine dehydrogenase-like Zn-dependent dehydrogenase